MNIIFVVGSLDFGGAERVVSVLANQLALMGHSVTIITLANNICKYPISEKVRLIYIDSSIKVKGISGLQRIFLLKSLIAKSNCDIVISFTFGISLYVLLAKLLYPFKLIVSERNDPNRDPSNNFLKVVRGFLYRFADGFVFQTFEAKEYFSNKINLRSIVISNPIKSGLPKPFNGKRCHRIITTGRLVRQKNTALTISAFAEFCKDFPDYTLEIYGTGPLENELKQQILDLKLEKVAFLKGNIDNWHEKVINADMFILSSNYEGMPNALMEAMAIGLPIISTNCPCGGPAYLVRNEINGLLTSVGNQEELVKCMKYYATHQDVASNIGCQAAVDMRGFNISDITEKWVDFINRIADK